VGAYRPKISIREIEDQVKAVLALSTKRAKRVVWIQHRSLQTMRLLIERSVYERYYRRLVRAVRANVNDSFEFIELERSFLVGRNYLLDGVHLSEEGHRRIAEIVGAKISP
jgi:lysophospholipase L1-like esterase